MEWVYFILFLFIEKVCRHVFFDTFFAFHLCFFATYPVFGHEETKLCYYEATKEVIQMIRRFLNSRWWHLTAAITALATVGYVTQVFSWLELLDINVWIILALMVCVAGFTMISGLLIIILERTQMIGILKALGARNKAIRHTFLWFSVFIIGQGLFWGNVLGIGIVILQQQTGFVSLDPQTYYVSEAPMELNIPLTLLINAATLLICVFVLIAPSYLISHIHPAKSMRYE